MRALCERCANSLAGLGGWWSVPGVMTAASIGAAKGGGYARYLESKTVEPERGDYYLTPEGEPTQAPGRWLASPDTLARLGIEGSAVEGPDFIALMEGRHPRTGGWLRRGGRRRRPRRRDRPDVQRPEVRLGRVGARRAAQRARHGGRARRRGQRGDGAPDRDGADRAPPLRRRRWSRSRRGISSPPSTGTPPPAVSWRATRPTRSCTAMSSSRARSARTGGSSRSPPGRSSAPRGRSARTTARRSRTSSQQRGYAIEAGHRQARPLLRDRRRAARAAGRVLRAQPRGRQGGRALPREVGSRARARGAAPAQAREPQGEGARHPRRPASRLERDGGAL